MSRRFIPTLLIRKIKREKINDGNSYNKYRFLLLLIRSVISNKAVSGPLSLDVDNGSNFVSREFRPNHVVREDLDEAQTKTY